MFFFCEIAVSCSDFCVSANNSKPREQNSFFPNAFLVLETKRSCFVFVSFVNANFPAPGFSSSSSEPLCETVLKLRHPPSDVLHADALLQFVLTELLRYANSSSLSFLSPVYCGSRNQYRSRFPPYLSGCHCRGASECRICLGQISKWRRRRRRRRRP